MGTGDRYFHAWGVVGDSQRLRDGRRVIERVTIGFLMDGSADNPKP